MKRRDAVDKNLLHRGIVVIVSNSKKDILVHKRSHLKKLYPGLYAVGIGGCVQYGESYDECAARELKEELGINVQVKFIFPWRFDNEWDRTMVHVYMVVYDGQIDAEPAEIESWRFVALSEVTQMLVTKNFCLGDGGLFEKYIEFKSRF